MGSFYNASSTFHDLAYYSSVCQASSRTTLCLVLLHLYIGKLKNIRKGNWETVTPLCTPFRPVLRRVVTTTHRFCGLPAERFNLPTSKVFIHYRDNLLPRPHFTAGYLFNRHRCVRVRTHQLSWV